MTASGNRRRRLEWLIRLVQYYRNWTRPQVAHALGVSDLRRLAPSSGDVRISIAVRLARLLDWRVDEVARYLWTEPIANASDQRDTPASNPPPDCDSEAGEVCWDLDGEASQARAQAEAASDSYADIDRAAWEAYQAGDFGRVVRLARYAYAKAESPEQRAAACNRELGGWDGLGRYAEALEAVRRGLTETPIQEARRLRLQSNLANAHYTLWNLTEARSVATEVVEHYLAHGTDDRASDKNLAFSYYVRGQTARRLIGIEPENTIQYAQRSCTDLQQAHQHYSQMGDEVGDDRFAGLIRLCESGLLESRTALSEVSADDALHMIIEQLEAVTDPEDWPAGEVLESYGWSCVFGCNIALRHLPEESQQRPMAILTNKAYEISDRLENWSLRERALVMESFRRQRLADWTGVNEEWMLDEQEVRIVTGTMARFPSFRRTGWRILNSARLVTEM
ncbi:MAG: hypothetical protein HND57_01650 [Planctomycetes bacterium]|nr:hypothetical protein [Planctomycetota bacterium]